MQLNKIYINFFILILKIFNSEKAIGYEHFFENKSLFAHPKLDSQDISESHQPIYSLSSRYSQSFSYFESNHELFLMKNNTIFQCVDFSILIKKRFSNKYLFYSSIVFNSFSENDTMSSQHYFFGPKLDFGINVPIILNKKLGLYFQSETSFTSNLFSEKKYLFLNSLRNSTGLFFVTSLLTLPHGNLSHSIGLGYYTILKDPFSQIPASFNFFYVPEKFGIFSSLGLSGFFSIQKYTPYQRLCKFPNDLLSENNPISDIISFTGKIGYQFKPLHQLSLSFEEAVWGRNRKQETSFSLLWSFQWPTLDSQSIFKKELHPQLTETTSKPATPLCILKVVDQFNLIKINHGTKDDIQVGQVFDIFTPETKTRHQEHIASGTVIHVRIEDAAVEIHEFFKAIPIEKNFTIKPQIESQGGSNGLKNQKNDLSFFDHRQFTILSRTENNC